MAKILTNDEFKSLVLEAKGKVLVDFFATWCGPCKMMAPVIDKLSQTADFGVYKVDVDQCPDVAEAYNIMSIPTLILFEDGKAVKKTVGAMSEPDLLNFVNA